MTPVTPEAEPLTPAEEASVRESARGLGMDGSLHWTNDLLLRVFATLDEVRAASPDRPEPYATVAAAVRDRLANYLWNEDDSGDENDLIHAYDDLRALLGPSTEEGVGETVYRASPDRLAGGLDEAWAKAEAALPEDWELVVAVGGHGRRDLYSATASYTYSLRYYRENVGRARSTPSEAAYADTPAAALLALADRLSGLTEESR